MENAKPLASVPYIDVSQIVRRKDVRRLYRQRNRDKILSAKKAYRARTVEKRGAYFRGWLERNRELVLEKKRIYRAKMGIKPRSGLLETMQERLLRRLERSVGRWGEFPYGKGSAKRRYVMRGGKRAEKAHRRAAQVKATPKWADRKAISNIYAEARRAGMTVDHIVPLNSELVCGLHVESNLQLLPMLENAKKANRDWPGKWT